LLKSKVIILLIFSALFTTSAQVNDSLISGRLAPNFILEDIDGNLIELNEFIGKGPILISFYASICKPCRDEIEAFSRIYREYKDKGLLFWAISNDSEKTVAKVKSYIKSKGYTFPVLLDTNRNVARVYYAQLVPYCVLINSKGLIVYSHQGYMKGDEILIKELLKNLLLN